MTTTTETIPLEAIRELHVLYGIAMMKTLSGDRDTVEMWGYKRLASEMHLAEPLVHKARNCARGLYQPCARAGGVCNTPCRAVCASKRRKGIQKRRCTSDLYAGS